MRNRRLVLTIACILFAGSCGSSLERVGNWAAKADDKTHWDKNEARGGVSVDHGRLSDVWDRHISSCRTGQTGALIFGTGSSDNILEIHSNGDNSYAVVYAPNGALRFDKSHCDTFEVKLAASGQPGSEALDCTQNGAALNSGIRFGPCLRR